MFILLGSSVYAQSTLESESSAAMDAAPPRLVGCMRTADAPDTADHVAGAAFAFFVGPKPVGASAAPGGISETSKMGTATSATVPPSVDFPSIEINGALINVVRPRNVGEPPECVPDVSLTPADPGHRLSTVVVRSFGLFAIVTSHPSAPGGDSSSAKTAVPPADRVGSR